MQENAPLISADWHPISKDKCIRCKRWNPLIGLTSMTGIAALDGVRYDSVWGC